MMQKPALYLSIALIALPLSAQAHNHTLVIGNFSANDISGWTEKVFNEQTHYELTKSANRTVLSAKSQASASTFYKDLSVDLNATPCLNWSWKVDNALDGLLEKTKAGDDFAARVYVVFSGGAAFWNTRALNYVWSGNNPIGSSWPNAYTDNSVNFVLESGQTKAGQWVTESRNVLKDVQRLIDQDLHVADGVAIMTDTDNSKTSAKAYFGDIYFSKSCG
ncbi:MAG: hypothetical protein COB46_06880 [Rhodospirillaceae bacterium]|nr:MAG: hypothetical protein COB46_06880 [Rhodospirillaceae bacterium]